MGYAQDILTLVSTMQARGAPFVLATVVRTVAATAAKAGAKAVILPNGTISEGWIGGGCARAAVLAAAKEALADGRSRLISVAPGDLLDDLGVKPGEEKEGVKFAKNSCPSQARWTSSSSRCCRVRRSSSAVPAPWPSPSPISATGSVSPRRSARPRRNSGPSPTSIAAIEGYALPVDRAGQRFIVVSTQGKGDEAALQAALAVDADYVAFVGSRKKVETLKAKLLERGVSRERMDALHAPAGLDLGAITPEEIALSILAQIVAQRRRAQPKEQTDET